MISWRSLRKRRWRGVSLVPGLKEQSSRPPVIVLGVPRSGTALLKEMLNHHSELAIPSESNFIPALWDRHFRRRSIETLFADLKYVRRIREWGINLEDVRRLLPEKPGFADVLQAVYRSYAESRGKSRFGDKTPMYLEYLELLEQVFPRAQYVHIVRDGRDAALSYNELPHRPPPWAYPRGLADFATRWRDGVLRARHFATAQAVGRYFELRYEDLIAEPEARLREICSFLGLRFEANMLQYHRDANMPMRGNHERLAEPPRQGLRNWRNQMSPDAVEQFEAIAGDVLSALGYQRSYPELSGKARARAMLDSLSSRGWLLAMRLIMPIVHRSPLWRWRQDRVLRMRGLSN